ncbi:NADPH-dependent FMN reductase [Patulibacter defluvii]|uniref:NADPH-dependent FMN reductase n=1 Tax=Patulibacter defluvii TaxID=3095358 RepID=UPI002A762BB2|nr:NADPH-dependent FMN reductase [Patulibacter sp. DM4]
MTRIIGISGSLRAGSHNTQLLETAARNAPEGVEIELYTGLADLPLYSEDVDGEGVPAAAAALRELVAGADAVLIATPEYNGSTPGGLKNAIDWLSRPYAAGAIQDKPVAVVGTALGQYGGVWAHDETRKALGIAGGAVIEDAKVSVPNSLGRFAELHPADDAEVVDQVAQVVRQLVDATKQPVAA